MSVMFGTGLVLACKALLGFGIAWLLWRVASRAPASARHALLASTLISALLLPALVWLAPDVEVAVLPAEFSRSTFTGSVGPSPAQAGEAPGTAPVLVIYFGVASWLLLRQIAGLVSLRRIRRSMARNAFFRRARIYRDLHPRKRRVRLFETSDVATPMTWGFFRPVVVLPAAAGDWAEQRVDEALVHELAHVRRGDWIVQRLAELCCIVYWFLPPVWVLARILRLEAEQACDDMVLNRFGARADYAAHLITLARAQTGAKALPGIAMATSSPLGLRVSAILDPGKRRDIMRSRALCAVLSAPFVFFSVLATLQATAAETPATVVAPSPPSERTAGGHAPDPVVVPDAPVVPSVPMTASPPAPEAFSGQEGVVAPAPPASVPPGADEMLPVPEKPGVTAREYEEPPRARIALLQLAGAEQSVRAIELREIRRQESRMERDGSRAERDLARAERGAARAARIREGAVHEQRALRAGEYEVQRALHRAERAELAREREVHRALRAEGRALRERERALRRAGENARRSDAPEKAVD